MSNTEILIPVLAGAVCVASAFLGKVSMRKRGSLLYSAGMLAAFLVLAGVALSSWQGDSEPWNFAILGLAAGIALAIVSQAFKFENRFGHVAMMALALLTASLIAFVPAEGIHATQLAAVFGAAVSAWIILASDKESGDRPFLAAIFLTCVIAADAMGREAVPYVTNWRSGIALGSVTVVVAFITCIALARTATKSKTNQRLIHVLVPLILLPIGALLVARRYLSLNDAFVLFSGGIISGVVVHFLVGSEEESSPTQFLIAVILWIGLATWAFSMQRGFGMSLSLLGAVSTLGILQNRRAMLSLGPLLGLVFYRVFREAHIDASQALDIGQHYALIGVALGATIPMLPSSWAASRRGVAAAALWLVLYATIPVAATVFLGAKGTVGFLAGLGFASVVSGLSGRKSLSSLVLAGGLAALIVLTYGWWEGMLDLTREDKLKVLIWIAPIVLIVGIAIALLSRTKTEVQNEAD